MGNEEYQRITEQLEARRKECLVQEKAYRLWLRFLTPLRWSSIIIGVVLPSFAGVAIFSNLLGEGTWRFVSAIVLLISGIVSGLHTVLKCDSHQSECVRLSNQYAVLALKYRDAIEENTNDILAVKRELSKEFMDLKGNTLTTPAQWCMDKAEKLI